MSSVSTIVPFVAKSALLCNYKDFVSKNLHKLVCPDGFVNHQTDSFEDVFDIEIDGWSYNPDLRLDFLPVYMSHRAWQNQKRAVALLNESKEASVGRWDISICSNNKDHLVHFLNAVSKHVDLNNYRVFENAQVIQFI